MASKALIELRAKVRKRRAAVTAKENRIKRTTGVDIKGTAADPRRHIDVVKRYNSTQLKAYFRELDAFMSRSNGFVAGAGDALIPKSKWFEYKRAERKYNAIGNREFDKIVDIHIPLNNMTVGEREKLMYPDSKRAQGNIIHRPYSPLNRDSKNIKSLDALEKLKNSVETKTKANFLPNQIAAARKQLEQMLKSVGNGKLNKQAEALSDAQFNVLWNYTGFPGAVSTLSDSGGHRSKNIRDADSTAVENVGVVEEYSNDIRELFGWAKSLELRQ